MWFLLLVFFFFFCPEGPLLRNTITVYTQFKILRAFLRKMCLFTFFIIWLCQCAPHTFSAMSDYHECQKTPTLLSAVCFWWHAVVHSVQDSVGVFYLAVYTRAQKLSNFFSKQCTNVQDLIRLLPQHLDRSRTHSWSISTQCPVIQI